MRSAFPSIAPDVPTSKESPEIIEYLAPHLHQLAESLGNAVDAKDPCTCEHSREVADLSQIIAQGFGFRPIMNKLIHIAGHLHDIGKIGIPDAVLKKPGPLTRDEWETVKRHPVIGANILRPVAALNGPGGVADMVLHHHESFDGTGYPFGLSGEDIPIGARIIAVADSFSAMLQPRPYKQARPFECACEEIVRKSGRMYDPKIVVIFLQCRRQIETWFKARNSIRPV